MQRFRRFSEWFDRNGGAVVAVASGAAFVLYAGLAFLRYLLVRANGLDLGIYGQVLWNTAHGRWFQFSVHPHSYLGDHLELLLPGIAPFAAVLGAIPALLLVQALALAATGPLAYALCRRHLPRAASVAVAVLFLASPFLLSTALYEFHALAFVVPALLGVILAYEHRSLRWFLILAGLALLVREDVALPVAGFGLLALWDRRSSRWWIPPLLGGSAWFVGSVKLIAHLSGYAQDKFLVYLRWLGDSPLQILTGLVRHPVLVLTHLFTINNLGVTIGLLGAFALLPLLATRRLIPVLPTFALILLGSGNVLVLQIHYVAPFIPFLLWAAVVGLARILRDQPSPGLPARLARERGMVLTVAAVTALYTAGFLGPLPQGIGELVGVVRNPSTQVRRALVLHLPDAPLATGYTFLAYAAERSGLASLHYQYLGTRQFSTVPYAIPDNVRSAVWDFSDSLIYQNLYPTLTDTKAGRDPGADRLTKFWTERNQRIVASLDGYALTEESTAPSPLPYDADAPAPEHVLDAPLADGLRLSGFDGNLVLSRTDWFGRPVSTLRLALTLSADRAPGVTRNLLLRFRDGRGRVRAERPLPVANGFYPTVEWTTGARVRTAYTLAIPRDLAGTTASAQLITPALTVVLSPLRTIIVQAPPSSQVGPEVMLGTVQAEGSTR